MKLRFLLGLMAFVQFAHAQTFTETTLSFPEDLAVDDSTIAFGDVDGDGDQDAIVMGLDSDFTPVTSLLINDGNGGFLQAASSFPDLELGDVGFSDVDGDGDLDVLLAGSDNNFIDYTTLFLNDGLGNFTEVSASFVALYGASFEFADLNGDGVEDLFLNGTDFESIFSLTYINDGAGNFTVGATLDGGDEGDVALGDVDGDGDLDAIVTGYNDDFVGVTFFYLNDGNGVFTPSGTNSFIGANGGGVDFADVDGDGDLDVAFNGFTGELDDSFFALYLNDGTGVFTQNTDVAIDLIGGSVIFDDADNDGDQDVYVSGTEEGMNTFYTRLYLNDGVGNFEQLEGTPFFGMMFGDIGLSDVDGDGDNDVFVTGTDDNFAPKVALYFNDLAMVSTENVIIDNAKASVFPNPSTGGQLSLDYIAEEHATVQISLFDTQGRVVATQSEQMSAGFNRLALAYNGLAKGVYYVKIANGAQLSYVKLSVQ